MLATIATYTWFFAAPRPLAVCDCCDQRLHDQYRVVVVTFTNGRTEDYHIHCFKDNV